MKPEDIDRLLWSTLEDRRLSRSERQALRKVMDDLDPSPEQQAFWRHRVFAVARDALAQARGSRDAESVLGWVEDAVKALDLPAEELPGVGAHFSPGTACLDCIVRLVARARHSVDICVFTITDDRVSRPIIEAHDRGVAVRIITDDDKSYDRGSDIERFERAGIQVRVDGSEAHMHHKFAVFDRRTLVTGSYNWTRSAAEYNRENIIVSDDPRLVSPFLDSFESLWGMFC